MFFKEAGVPDWVWNVGADKIQAINADAIGARYYETDIAISIHANMGGGEARGHETWHHTHANFGRKLAAMLDDALLNLPNPSRGIKCDSAHDRYAFWRETQGQIMSHIEYFFIDNEQDHDLMKLQENIILCAQLTYNGLVNFIETYAHNISWVV